MGKLIPITIPLGFHCWCPCPRSEPQSTFASSGDPPRPVGRSTLVSYGSTAFLLGSSAYEYRDRICLLQELSLFFSQPFGATAPGPSGLPGSIFWGFFHQCQPQTVLEDYFYVEMSLCSLHAFNILVPGLFLVWLSATSLLSVCWLLSP